MTPLPSQQLLLTAVLLLCSMGQLSASPYPRNDSMSLRKLKKSSKQAYQGPTKRNCKLKSKSEKVEYQCDSTGEEGGATFRDNIKFKVEAKSAKSMKIKVEYKQETDASTTTTDQGEEATSTTPEEVKTKYEIVFDRVVEYRKPSSSDEEGTAAIAVSRQGDVLVDPLEPQEDSEDSLSTTAPTGREVESSDDGDDDPNRNAFDWENDEILQEWPMTEWAEFSDIEENGSLIQFSAATEDDIAKFFFTLAEEDLEDLSVNKMKIDFELADFPWSADDSYVALLCSVTSEEKVTVVDDEQVEQRAKRSRPHKYKKDVEISFDDATDKMEFVPFGAYTWKSEAEVLTRNIGSVNGTESNSTDTETISVIATSPTITEGDDDGVNQMAFSFVGRAAQGAQDIFWDPSAGVDYSAATAKSFLCSFAIGTFAMFLTTM